MSIVIGNNSSHTHYGSATHNWTYAHTVHADSKMLLVWLYAGYGFGTISTHTYNGVEMELLGAYENIILYALVAPAVGAHNVHFVWEAERKPWSWCLDLGRATHGTVIYDSLTYKEDSCYGFDKNVNSCPGGLLVGTLIKTYTQGDNWPVPEAGETVLHNEITSVDGIYRSAAYYKQVTGLSKPGNIQTEWSWTLCVKGTILTVCVIPAPVGNKIFVYF